MKISNSIGIGANLSIEGVEVNVNYIFSDKNKRIFRVESKDKQRYRFIIFNDQVVSKVFKFKNLPAVKGSGENGSYP